MINSVYDNQIQRVSEERLERYFETMNEIQQVWKNREYWKYSLNFRGFLLYLNGEYQSRRKETNSRIRQVISNPRVMEKAPFLRYWQDFEKAGFDIVGHLKDIGMEYRNQLEYDAQDDYLLSMVSERYFVPLENILFFNFLKFPYFFVEKLGTEQYSALHKKINEYRSITLKLLRNLLSTKIEKFDKLREVYQHGYIQ